MHQNYNKLILISMNIDSNISTDNYIMNFKNFII